MKRHAAGISERRDVPYPETSSREACAIEGEGLPADGAFRSRTIADCSPGELGGSSWKTPFSSEGRLPPARIDLPQQRRPSWASGTRRTRRFSGIERRVVARARASPADFGQTAIDGGPRGSVARGLDYGRTGRSLPAATSFKAWRRLSCSLAVRRPLR